MSDAGQLRGQLRGYDGNHLPTMTKCECCGKRVFVAWFAMIPRSKLKCGECARPRRAEIQRVFPDHDAGDEDRTETP